MARELGPVGTKVVFENDQVRVWVLRLAPGGRSAVHQHDLGIALTPGQAA